MASFTGILSVSYITTNKVKISLNESTSNQSYLINENSSYYSPIFSAYLKPDQPAPNVPDVVDSIFFIFSKKPYNLLGELKPNLDKNEQENVYFSQGLASLVLINFSIERIDELIDQNYNIPMEYWILHESVLDLKDIVISNHSPKVNPIIDIKPHDNINKELFVYSEQIYACLNTLKYVYSIYYPDELKTLIQISKLLCKIFDQYNELKQLNHDATDKNILVKKQLNSLISALVEISAALSYASTQGTTGCAPILLHRSPFPHLSLLGTGGAIRALTKLTRYFESAFSKRSAAEVIKKQYKYQNIQFNKRLSIYDSGPDYVLSDQDETKIEEFDKGGDFYNQDDFPLIAHFSLRHGFKESKFSVTAASECLTDSLSPQWTLMTISHEIMHSRVRDIFQALFGVNWDDDTSKIITDKYYKDFKDWLETPRNGSEQYKIDTLLRNIILYFCYSMEKISKVKERRSNEDELEIRNMADVEEKFHKYKILAVELFVHFHDFYFTYAYQPKIYTISLWASWIKVAAPIKKPLEYLVRTLATLACGTGLKPTEAFNNSIEIFIDSIEVLESVGIKSPIFNKLKEELNENDYDRELIYIRFKLAYYLIDQVRLYFASNIISDEIIRLENDPFAEGSTEIENYSSNIYIYGENEEKSIISPVRHLLSSFIQPILYELPINDYQWLSAWNTILISSQEV